MRFFEQARNLLTRGEVDDHDRGTQQILGHRDEVRTRDESIASLRQFAADARHPDLSAAIKRRNAAR